MHRTRPWPLLIALLVMLVAGLTVVDGSPTGAAAVAADGSGELRGRVVDTSGRPVAGATILLHERDGEWSDDQRVYPSYSHARTDDDGRFHTGVPAGVEVRIEVVPWGSLAPGFYPRAATLTTAKTVTADPGEVVEGLDVTLVEGARIAGSVRGRGFDFRGANPQVTVQQVYGPDGATRVDAVNPRVTWRPGFRFVVGRLAAGTYRICFGGSEYPSVYDGGCWDGVGSDGVRSQAVVEAGERVDIGATRLTRPRAIFGQVVDTQGRPVAGVSVGYAYLRGGGQTTTSHGAATDVTDADGRWSLVGLEPGIYRIRFGKPEGPWQTQWWPRMPTYELASDIVLDDDGDEQQQRGGIDAVLTPGGRIVGPGPDVNFLDYYDLATYRRQDGRWMEQHVVRVQRNRYAVGALPTGTYRICLRDSFLEVNRQCMDPVAVTAGDEVRRPLAFRPTGTVSGTVVTPAPGPGDDPGDRTVSIVAYRRHPSDGTGITSPKAFKEQDGSGPRRWDAVATTAVEPVAGPVDYTIKDVPPGTYRIKLTSTEGEVFWPDAPDFETATDVVVREGGAVEGIDLETDEVGSISGTMTLRGEPETTNVHALREDALGHWRPVVTTTEYDEETGRYTLGGLAAGTYRLRFGVYPYNAYSLRGGFAPRYWPQARTLAEAGDVVVGDDAAVTDVDMALTPEGGITVGGWARGSVRAVAFQRVGDRWLPAASKRYYGVHRYQTIAGLEPGRYRLAMIDLEGYWTPEFWEGSRTLEGAQDITVVEDETTEELVFELDPPVRNQVPARVTGTARVGRTLRLQPGVWSPDDAQVSIQWLAGGRPVPGARGLTYRVRATDVGQRVSVRLVGTRPDFESLQKETPRTATVRR